MKKLIVSKGDAHRLKVVGYVQLKTDLEAGKELNEFQKLLLVDTQSHRGLASIEEAKLPANLRLMIDYHNQMAAICDLDTGRLQLPNT